MNDILQDKKNTVYIINNDIYEKLKNKPNSKLINHVKELDGYKYIEYDENLINEDKYIKINNKIILKDLVKGIELNGFSNKNGEEEFWSLHHKVGLSFKIDELPKKDFKIKFEINPFINEKNKRVRTNVYVNGKKLAKWIFKKDENYPLTEIIVPKNLIKKMWKLKLNSV